MLCNDTRISENRELTGDPTETALIDLGFKLGCSDEILKNMTRIGEIPFDSDRKLMTVIVKSEPLSNPKTNVGVGALGDPEPMKYLVYTKGGLEELLNKCSSYVINGEIKKDLDEYIPKIMSENENMAKNALRVLAFAYKELDHMPSKEEVQNIEKDLIFIGIVGMIDPARVEAKEAVNKCKTAGIKVIMITGDHAITASAIAKDLGILKDEDEVITGAHLEKMSNEELIKNVRKYSVYARVSPEHKVRIVKAWQANGEVVAMTGDGVNDAPALKTADIGCAMGMVGTDVSKEAADLILTDDNFATIVSAVEEGRRIYDNILKAIQFLISSNIGEVITLFVAIMLTPLIAKWFGLTDIAHIVPLLPIHILWINLVTDSLPALALAVEPATKEVMNRKPIKASAGIFTKGLTFRVSYQGLMIGIITLSAFCLGLSTPNVSQAEKIQIGQTMAFFTLGVSQLTHVFNAKSNKLSLFKIGILNNTKLIWASLVSAILMFATFIPGIKEIFGLAWLPIDHVIELIILIFAPIVIVEIMKLLKLNGMKDE